MKRITLDEINIETRFRFREEREYQLVKKTFLTLSLVALLGVGGVLGYAAPAQAESVGSINSKINSLQDELEAASMKLAELTTSINNTQADIKSKEQEITAAEEKMATLQTEINTILERIEARNDVLKERARSLQESGGTISYLEVLVGSQSFSDFITRAEAVMTIVTADKDMLLQQKSDMERVETAKAEVESSVTSLEKMHTELKAKEEQLLAAKQEQAGKEQGYKDQIASLEQERSQLMAQIPAVETTTKPVVSLVASVNTETPQVQGGNGGFSWPTVGGYISSYQGPRGGEYHKGIDIARPSDYSILASRGGTVYYTGWYYSAGLTVKIKHDNGYTTEYSHLNQILVQEGQTVSQGQKIGIMGATGEATGVHLDFKVYQNGNLLNPLSVLK